MTSAIILVGNVRHRLLDLDASSVQTCVTSPPYYGKRDYDHADQIGLESRVEEYVDTLVAVFREVRRILRDDGSPWVNIGDSYGGSGRGSVGKTGRFQHTNGIESRMTLRRLKIHVRTFVRNMRSAYWNLFRVGTEGKRAGGSQRTSAAREATP